MWLNTDASTFIMLIQCIPFAWISSLIMIKCEKMTDCDDEHVDRISDLPMMWLIASTTPVHPRPSSVLSREWRYMWASTPRLEFKDDFFLRSWSILNTMKLLALLQKLFFSTAAPYMTLLSSLLQTIPIKLECLTKWILFLSRKGVTYIGFARKGVTHIFSCRDLTCLFLLNFRFSVAPTFHGFQSMIELHLFDIIFE